MSQSRRPYNFSAGPAILPQPVFERAGEAIRDVRTGGHAKDQPGIGLSLLEISHRSKPFDDIHEGAIQLCHGVLGIPDTHKVLLLQGGASLQFVMVPMNLRQEGKPACFVETGAWSKKAIRESKVLGETKVLASSADTTFDHIPDLPAAASYAGASYLHITTNNTIYGTEFPDIPELAGDVPLAMDFSSNVGSRAMDFGRVGLAYAGAQKNLGPSGVTLVVIRKDLLEREVPATVPHFLRYQTHAEKNSLYNTPNTFGILVLKLVLEWMRDEGGVSAVAERNERKADKLYDLLDGSSLYRPHARAGSRSRMNVTWTLTGNETEAEERTKRFLAQSGEAGFSGLKGHRSVGGCRASIYNAFPEAGVDELCEFMREFERKG